MGPNECLCRGSKLSDRDTSRRPPGGLERAVRGELAGGLHRRGERMVALLQWSPTLGFPMLLGAVALVGWVALLRARRLR